MTYKIAFNSGPWRTVEADCHTVDERFLVLIKEGQPVLTAVLANVDFFDLSDEREIRP
jgi:hypothetical protein